MIHLRPADYRRQPWANGRGVTTELYRQDQNGALLVRLSMATVTEDGPFSLFPGIERNLTVLTGPGFTLTGEGLSLKALPLTPVTFPGDLPVTATNVTAPSDDFNVMTARHLPRPEVRVVQGPASFAAGGTLGIFALGPAQVDGRSMAPHDLIMTENGARMTGPVLAIRIFS